MTGIDTAIDRIASVAKWCIEPTDPCEVSAIVEKLDVALPAEYLRFLHRAGHGFEPLEGSNYCIDDDLPGMQKRAETIACKNNVQLPSDSFVFLEHQGFAYNFFLLQDGDDPAVYELVDGHPTIDRVNLAFSQWLSDVVDRHLAILEHKAKQHPLFDKPKR